MPPQQEKTAKLQREFNIEEQILRIAKQQIREEKAKIQNGNKNENNGELNQPSRPVNESDIRAEQEEKHKHYCENCDKRDHCWKCCHRNGERKNMRHIRCRYCKQNGHDQKCCNKFYQFLIKQGITKRKRELKYQAKVNGQGQIGHVVARDDSDDEVIMLGNDARSQYMKRQSVNMTLTQQQNQFMIQSRNFTQDRFNIVVAEELKKLQILQKFEEEQSCNLDRALDLYQLIRKLQTRQPDDFGELIVFQVSCDNDNRDQMENMLKQTNGIGSTFFDYSGKQRTDICGLWIMPKNCENKKPRDFMGSKVFKMKILNSKQFFDQRVEQYVLERTESTDQFELIKNFWSFHDEERAEFKMFIKYN